MKIIIRYKVVDNHNGYLYMDKDLEKCIEYVKKLRKRNSCDGWDEYWHKVEIKIIKEELKTSVVEVYKEEV